MFQQICAVTFHYILDAIVVIALIIFALKDARKGFVGCLLGFATTLLALVIAFTLADEFVGWTGNFFGLAPKLEKGIINKLSSIKAFALDVSNEGLKETLAGTNLPSFIADAIVAEVGDSTIPAGTTIAMLAGAKIAEILIVFLAGVVLFFVSKLVLKLIAKILNGVVNSIPLVGGVNRLLGAAVGAIKCFLIVCTILSVLSFIPSAGVSAFMDKTLFVGALYKNNPLGYILSWIGL